MLELYLVGLAVPITLAILGAVFWAVTKALKEYVTREVNIDVDELKAEFRTFAKDLDTVLQTRFGNVDATMKTSFGQVAQDVHSIREDVHAQSEMQQRLTQIAISHDAMIKELQKKG